MRQNEKQWQNAKRNKSQIRTKVAQYHLKVCMLGEPWQFIMPRKLQSCDHATVAIVLRQLHAHFLDMQSGVLLRILQNRLSKLVCHVNG